MARVIKVKNASGSQGTWVGQVIGNGEYYNIQENEVSLWVINDKVFTDVGSGNLIVNKGADTVDDIINPINGWNWLSGDTLPRSALDNTKVAVHSSPKPITENTTYAVWQGAGDLLEGSPIPEMNIGKGDFLIFNMTPGTSVMSKNMKFDPQHGRVWIHEGYAKFDNAGFGDYLIGDVIAPPTQLQPYVNLIGYVENNWFKPALPGSPSLAVLGFAATPALIPRTLSKDGEWDYDGVNLTPNFANTGDYRISTIERNVHRYANVPALGTTNNYFIMSSDETTELPEGYFIRITAHNVSNTSWTAAVFIEMFRERTYVP